MKTVININDIVYVELGEQGWDILRKHYEDLYRAYPDVEARVDEGVGMYKRRTHKYLQDGWRELTQFQMHELMNIFGSHCTIGVHPLFVGNNIYPTVDESTKIPNEYDIERLKNG